MFQSLRTTIEKQRGSKNPLWKAAIFAKDISWAVFSPIETHLKKMKEDWKPVRLSRLDSQKIPKRSGRAGNKTEILAFMVVRNESLRLPALLKYYFEHGVDRFFIVDNDSTDGTVPFLLTQKNVHVFKSNKSFGEFKFGSIWIRALMKRYGRGHWCLAIDADEILAYPHCETVSFKQLCDFLDSEGSTAMESLLLEMYSDKPLRALHYQAGENLISAFPYFDGTINSIVEAPREDDTTDRAWYRGGMRERVFGIRPLLNKACLIKFDGKVKLVMGQHFANGAKISAICGAVLHFKYTPEFMRRVSEEAQRKEHWNGAEEYIGMAKKLEANPDLSFHYSGSAKFEKSNQLVELGIMKTSGEFENFA